MVKIIIENLGQKEIAWEGEPKSLLSHFQGNRIDWLQSCGGKGRCTTCKALIIQGMSNLGRATPAELRYRNEKLLGENERLTCQTRVTGDVVVRVPDECKLSHIKYT